MSTELIGLKDPEWHTLLTKQQIMRRLLNQFHAYRPEIRGDDFFNQLTNLYIDLELDYKNISWLMAHLPETTRQARQYLDYQEIKKSLEIVLSSHIRSLEKLIAIVKP